MCFSHLDYVRLKQWPAYFEARANTLYILPVAHFTRSSSSPVWSAPPATSSTTGRPCAQDPSDSSAWNAPDCQGVSSNNLRRRLNLEAKKLVHAQITT